ncbi:PIN domain-containing protein [candidate division KSB1 bacterium]|nr:PIN domain-containing protein [candidate division KSB1 bacterium]
MVMVDTGFWLALANKKDEHHERAKSVLASINAPLITTWPVMTETCYLLLMRINAGAQVAFIKSYETGAFKAFELSGNHAARIHELLEKYAGLPMDLADASLVVLAEHLGDGQILSTDVRDFSVYRWKDNKTFENLFLK